MELKLLHSADWHLDSSFNGFSEEDRQFLRTENLRIPDTIVRMCRREQCSILLLAGDLFDGPYTRDSLDALRNALEDAQIPVFVSPGNHDCVGPDSPWLTEHFPGNVQIFTGETECRDLPELDARVWGAGYRSMDCPPLLKEFHATQGPSHQIGVFHGDGRNPASSYCPVTASQAQTSGLQYLALGHIHQAGGFRAGDTLCAWPGCPMGRGWDETGEKGALLVTLGEIAQIQTLTSELPCFFALTADVGSDAVSSVAKILPGDGQRNFYRVTLTGRGNADLAEISGQFPQFPHLKLIDRTLPPVNFDALAGEDTLRGLLFRKLLEAARTPGNEDRAQLAGQICADILDGQEVSLP